MVLPEIEYMLFEPSKDTTEIRDLPLPWRDSGTPRDTLGRLFSRASRSLDSNIVFVEIIDDVRFV